MAKSQIPRSWEKSHCLQLYSTQYSEHLTNYSHIASVSRKIHTKQCCCTVCTNLGCNFHGSHHFSDVYFKTYKLKPPSPHLADVSLAIR